MNIHEEPRTPSGPSNDDGGRSYLIDMIRSLSVLARRSDEEELAILLEAIAASSRVRDRRSR